MTPEQKRITIAKACGWKCWEEEFGRGEFWTPPHDHHVRSGQKLPPDYLNDLNAMHEAIESLRNNQFHYVDYFKWLFFVATNGLKWDGKNLGYFGFNLINATAAQRAEAFGLTLKLWT